MEIELMMAGCYLLSLCKEPTSDQYNQSNVLYYGHSLNSTIKGRKKHEFSNMSKTPNTFTTARGAIFFFNSY